MVARTRVYCPGGSTPEYSDGRVCPPPQTQEDVIVAQERYVLPVQEGYSLLVQEEDPLLVQEDDVLHVHGEDHLLVQGEDALVSTKETYSS